MKGVSIVGHLLVLCCFLLPFLTVSCQGQKISTLSGLDLVVGKTIKQENFGQTTERKSKPEPLAIAAAVCMVTALALVSLSRSGAVTAILANIGGVVTLLLLKSKIIEDAAREASGMVVTFESGFFLALGGAILCAVINGSIVAQKGKEQSRVSAPEKTVEGRYCGSCGNQVPPGTTFCERCGSKIRNA